MVIDTDNYVDVTTAAQMLNVTATRISALCRSGRFPNAIYVGRTRLIPKKEVEGHTKLKPGVKPKSPKDKDNRAFITGVLEQMKGDNKNEQ